MVKIKKVESKSDWNEFIDLPWVIYANDAQWVPPLKIAVRDTLDVAKNPFFKHASMQAWLAVDDSQKVLGRIVAVVDDNHNKFHQEKTGFFGFFECVQDYEVAKKLFDQAHDWLKSKGMTIMRGPMNPSTNHEAGLLVEGFQDPPTVMMTYNPPYYGEFFERWGLSKTKDLFAYIIDHRTSKFSDRLFAHAEKAKSRGGIVFRPVRMNEFEKEIDRILEIYNDAWEKNWGFVPMEPEEFRHMAKDMKAIVDPEMLLIAEIKQKPVAFALALPDVNQAFKKVKDGKLFPTGLLKLLWYAKGPGKKKTINRCRIITLGVKQAYREAGLGPLFYVEYLKRGPANGYPAGEASWILEDNIPMNRALQQMDAKRTKVYRIYDKTI